MLSAGVLEKQPGEMLGDLPGVHTRAPRTNQYAVLAFIGVGCEVARVSDIDHLENLKPKILKAAADEIGHNGGAHASNVGLIIGCRTTIMHPHPAGFYRTKYLYSAGQGVTDLGVNILAPCVAFNRKKASHLGRLDAQKEILLA